ncbi:MAG: methyltransferase domain-containing protein [Janthinobacterium lividum]
MNIENSRDYYGQVLQGSSDLRTDACCTMSPPPAPIRLALEQVHPEVRARYYGCGLVAPEAIAGKRVLDLGSGAGQDSYVLAQLVGEHGEVVGIDATPEQLAVAERHIDWHRDRFGYARSNVSFLHGDIEHLDALDLEPGSFDLIVSNCVINLVADKGAVFRAAHRLLREGGEMHFADVYADRRLPAGLRDDPVLHGECLAGASYWGDFLGQARQAGFIDPRLVTDRPLGIDDPAIASRLGGARFFSATWRLFRLSGLDAACEDYGQAVRYLGTLPDAEASYLFDKHHRIETGRVFPVCRNTWSMLADTRLRPHFEFLDGGGRHFGIFAGCGTALPFDQASASGGGAAACC